MRCDHCGRDAITFQDYSGHHLCGEHFQRDLEARAKRAIRAHGWIRTGDRIAIALSGGRSSSSLLHFLSAHFGARRDLSLVAITVDECDGSRDMDRIRGIAGGMGIEWAGISLAEGFGDIPAGIPAPGNGEHPCPCRGFLLGRALDSLARRVGATKLALGRNLDDEARSVFLHVLMGEAARLLCGSQPGEGVIPWMRPFFRIPEEDLSLYARLNLQCSFQEQGLHAPLPLESEAGRILAEFTHRHPSTLFSLVNLGEALSDKGGVGSGEPHLLRCHGEVCSPRCPAREIPYG